MKASFLAIPNGIAIPFALAVLIVGITVASHKIPGDHCLGLGSTSSSSTRDDINRFAFIAGLPAIIGGILGAIGAFSGIGGGLQKNKCMLCTSIPLYSIAIFGTVISLFVALLGKAIADEICSNATCSGELCSKGCTVSLSDCQIYCKSDYDAFCDYGKKSMAALALGILAIAAIVFACVANCSARCCCPQNFEMGDAAQVQQAPVAAAPAVAAPVAQVVVVGQPQGNEGQKSEQVNEVNEVGEVTEKMR